MLSFRGRRFASLVSPMGLGCVNVFAVSEYACCEHCARSKQDVHVEDAP